MSIEEILKNWGWPTLALLGVVAFIYKAIWPFVLKTFEYLTKQVDETRGDNKRLISEFTVILRDHKDELAKMIHALDRLTTRIEEKWVEEKSRSRARKVAASKSRAKR